MQSETFTTMAADGTPLHTFRWVPQRQAKAIVQIAHGMAEHAARYERFAAALTAAGYAVYANDHRGHGGTHPVGRGHGYFADRDGFATVVDDMRAVTEVARAENPDLPVFLFGHSMGSFLARAYAARFGSELAGLVLSGTAGDQGVLGKVGLGLALAEARVRGRHHVSPLLDSMSFGQYGKAFKPTRTKFDWLSRDEAEVDKYVADPLCGNVFTAGFFVDLIRGLNHIHDPATTAKVPADLPIHLMAGSMDPVGAQTKGVDQVAAQYRKAGVAQVTTRYYLGGRHELLNETNRDEVTADLIGWLDAHLPA
ncbi:MAG: alpha/beta hydrolase [Tetrasphaera sp.]